MINLNDVPDGIKELDCAARLGLAGGNTARVYNFDLARLTAPA
jgi:hypothetical protein